MNLSPQWLDELRARTTLSALVGRSVKLTKAGREYKACCPFHNEKTPSFYVNDEKGFYHCFGCSAHGDAIRWMTDQQGLPFMDAVKELATSAGMDVPAPDPRAQERAEEKRGLIDVTEAAAAWFTEQLQGIEGSSARAYLEKRGLKAATVARFGLGFAPDSRGKLKAALDRFGDEALVESGMLIRPDEGDKPSYDRFRGRLMIPIRDARGRTIAFGGRILGDGEPKYLNSPETPLFDKGRTLYNLDRASPASRKAKRVIVVEGYMDVIAMDAAGIEEVVAPLGTALTEGQLERLWRMDGQPILCFDGDAAGQKAAIRAALRALPLLGAERTLRFVALPAGEDPDDLLKARGRAAMDALLAEPEPLVERLWRHERDAQPLDTPEARAGLKSRLFDHANAIPDPSLKSLYRDEWLRRFDALVRPPRRQPAGPRPFGGGAFGAQGSGGRPGSYRPAFVPPTSAAARAIGADGIDPSTARAVVIGHALHPDLVADHLEALADLPLADAASESVRDALIDAAHRADEEGTPLDAGRIAPILASDGIASHWTSLLGAGDPGYSFTRPRSDPARAKADLRTALDALIQSAQLASALHAATRAFEERMDEESFAQQQALLAAKREINERLASLASDE